MMGKDLIELLARQAGLQFNDAIETWSSYPADGVYEEALANLAYLIADECAQVVDGMAAQAEVDMEPGPMIDYFRERAAAIRERFAIST